MGNRMEFDIFGNWNIYFERHKMITFEQLTIGFIVGGFASALLIFIIYLFMKRGG